MKKRNIITEIKERQLRTMGLQQVGYIFRLNELDTLLHQIDSSSPGNSEVLRYLPIGVIATLEGHLRILYSIIIDQDSTYLSNAVRFFKEQNLRFDPEFLVALNGKKATVGEIFAHFFQFNSFEDINKTLSTLLQLDFLHEIRNFERPQDFELYNDDPDFRVVSSATFEALKRMFTLRHIAAHELGLDITLNSEQILSDYQLIKNFLDATTTFVELKIGVYTPPQQHLQISTLRMSMKKLTKNYLNT